MNSEDEFVVIRTKKSLRERLSKLAKKKNQTLTAVTNKAIENFLENEEYNLNDVLEIARQNSSLKVSINKLEEEMKNCPPYMCKQIIEIIKDKEVFLFEDDFDNLEIRINKIEKVDLYGLFIHFSMKEDRLNKINEIMKKIPEIFKGNEIKIGAGAKGGDHDKILLFVSYNKK